MKTITKSDLSKLPHTLQVYFALFCAKQVSHLVKPEHKVACDKALETAELWLDGKATAKECKTAANAAWFAARTAANAANYAAAAAAAYANVDKQAIVEAQWAYYKELLAFNTIVEDVLLA